MLHSAKRESYRYTCYGLTIGSAFSIPYLREINHSTPVDVVITVLSPDSNTVRQLLPYSILFSSTLQADLHVEVWLLHNGNYCVNVRYQSGSASYIVDRHGQEIQLFWTKNIAFIDVLPYLFGAALGIVLRLKGTTCLHGSAVAVDGRAIILVGRSGVGKSTLGAAFLEQGYPLISEDVLALRVRESKIYVEPGYAGLRLRADVAMRFPNLRDSISQKSVQLSKNYYNEKRVPSLEITVGAIYVLTPRKVHFTEPAIMPLNKLEGLMVLDRNKYLGRLDVPEWRLQDFQILSLIADCVPIKHLDRQDDLNTLESVTQALLADFRSVVRK